MVKRLIYIYIGVKSGKFNAAISLDIIGYGYNKNNWRLKKLLFLSILRFNVLTNVKKISNL